MSGGEQLKVESGAMMAHSIGMALEAKMEGGALKSLKRSVLGGESLYVSTFTAPAEGETVVVDTNHMLSFVDTVSFELKRAVEGRSIQSIKSGEGWVFHFTGPGEILVQTRNQQQLIAWINTEIGSRE